MLIPLGTDRPLRRPTVVNHALIGVNVGVYFAGLALDRIAPDAAQHFEQTMMLDPGALTWWGFFTYQFVHGGFLHILANMVFLYVFGPNVEDRFGRIGYPAFYLLGGAAAAGMQLLFGPARILGASGSIAAVTGAYFVLFPRTHIKTFVLFIFMGIMEIPAGWFIGFALATDIVMQGMGHTGGVALLAHIGGYAFGIGVSLALLATGLLPREGFDLFSIGKHAARRRAFKEITCRGHQPWIAGASDGVAPSSAPPGGAAGKKGALAPPVDPRRQEARAEVGRLLGAGKAEEAAAAYRRFVGEIGAFSLGAKSQLEVANQLFQEQDHRGAAAAYTLFLEHYERDKDAARVRLMLGLLCARYTGETERAGELLERARATVSDEEQRKLAESLLAEIGGEATERQRDEATKR